MAEPVNNSSFIPKRGPVRRRLTSASRQVYLFTIISYVLMFATLLGVGAVFLYDKHVRNQLDDEVVALSEAVKGFSEEDMLRVQDFDFRLIQASERFKHSVSIPAIFAALEAAIIDSVKINSLELTREKDDMFLLSASMETDTFDSTIFQRGVYERDKTISSINISEFSRNSSLAEEEEPKTTGVDFVAELTVPLSAVSLKASSSTVASSIKISTATTTPSSVATSSASIGSSATTSVATSSSATSTGPVKVNQSNI